MDEKQYSELSRYFTLKEWNNMSEYDRIRYYNILENYKVLHSLDLTTKRPDFMCVTKRPSEQDEWPSKRKHAKRAAKMKSKVGIVPSKEENAWLFNPSPGVLAQDIQEDFLGFPEADFVGENGGPSALNEAIKKLESEIQNLVEVDTGSAEEAESPRRRYPKRSVTRKDYAEGSLPDDDDYIFCDDCNQEWEGDCPVHGPLTAVEDTKVPPDPTDPTRADRTVPPQLCIAQSGISGAGYGVWTRVPLAKGLRFGPYEGVKVKSSNSNGYCWQIRRNSRPLYCVDAQDCGVANWMRFVNCARHEEEQNLMAFQYKGEMYYRTFKHVPAHAELLVWYGDDYGRELGIDVESFHKPQQKQSHNVFCCVGCGIMYSSPVYLEKHVKYCRGLKGSRLSNSSAACRVKCSSSNSNDSTVIDGNRLCHYNGHEKRLYGNSNHVKYSCTSDTCDSRCFKKSELSEHITDKMHQGRLHGQKLRHTISVTAHTATHTGENCYEDGKYGQKCTARQSLFKWQTNDTGEKWYVCTECSHKSPERSNLVQHSQIHTGEKPFVCNVCGYKCAQRTQLVRHSRIHTGEKPFVCNVCGYKCAQSYNLVRHSRIHTGEKPFVCNVCSYKCAQSSDLETHSRIHTGEKPFVCNVCGYKCARRTHLVRHSRIHTGEKPFVCNVCGYKCAQRTDLVSHSRIHTGEKPFVCNVCGYKCARRTYLVSHSRIHTGEKPFVCNVCGYKCAQKTQLVQHSRIHTGEKPFVCNLCGYKCAQRTQLVQHSRIHTGEKPFVCNECGHKFTQRSSLIRHTSKKCYKMSAHTSNHISHGPTHTKAHTDSHTNAPSEVSKPNATQSQTAMNLISEE